MKFFDSAAFYWVMITLIVVACVTAIILRDWARLASYLIALFAIDGARNQRERMEIQRQIIDLQRATIDEQQACIADLKNRIERR